MHSRISGRTRLLVRLAAPLAVALAAAVMSPASALAAKGGKGASSSGSSITLDQAGQTLHLGDTVTFTTVVAPLKGNEYPMVDVQCFSATDGSMVYAQLDHPDAQFVLGSGSQWSVVGGAAHCVGHLYSYPSVTELASPVAFDAQG